MNLSGRLSAGWTCSMRCSFSGSRLHLEGSFLVCPTGDLSACDKSAALWTHPVPGELPDQPPPQRLVADLQQPRGKILPDGFSQILLPFAMLKGQPDFLGASLKGKGGGRPEGGEPDRGGLCSGLPSSPLQAQTRGGLRKTPAQ